MASEHNPSEQSVLDALRTVMDPDLHKDIVALNFVKNLKIENGKVSFTVELTTPACPVKDKMQEWARAAVLQVQNSLPVSGNRLVVIERLTV